MLGVSRGVFCCCFVGIFFGVEVGQINLDLHDFLLKSSPHKLFQCFLTCHLRTIMCVQLSSLFYFSYLGGHSRDDLQYCQS